MKLSPWIALVLVGGCVDAANDGDAAGGGKADNGAAFGNVTTAWELTVGYGGDAVVAGVSVQPDGKLLVRSHFPHWLHRVTTDGKFDHTFGSLYGESWTNEHSGTLGLPVWDVWQVSGDRFIAPVGEGWLSQLRSFHMADGSDDTAFGTAGAVSLVETGLDAENTVAAAYDKHGHRALALVVREWQKQMDGPSSYWLFGPSKFEVIAYDATTGAATSLGTHQMPKWTGDGSSQPHVFGLVPQPDGSVLALIKEPFDKTLNDPATRWLQVHLRTGQAPELTTLAISEYDPPLAGFVALPDGGYDVYISGRVDGISTSDNDKRLVRISVDGSLTAHVTALDTALPTFSADCSGYVATPGYLLYGHSPDRSKPIEFTAYPKSGAPIHFKSDKPQRCLTSLSLGPDNHIYAGTWDTTNEGWTAQLTSFE